MSLKTYSDLIDQVEPYLMGCPIPVIMQRLQNAGREFCRETELLTETITLDAVAGQREYTLLPLYADGSIKRVAEVRCLSADDVAKGLDGAIFDQNYYQIITGTTATAARIGVTCPGVSDATGVYSATTETVLGQKVYSHTSGNYVVFCGYAASNEGTIFYLCSRIDYLNWKNTNILPANCFYTPAPNIGVEGNYSAQGAYSGLCEIVSYGSTAYTLKFSDVAKPNNSITGGLVVTVAIEPNVNATRLPEWFLNEYAEAIVAGALWKLYSLPRQSWSSPRDAAEQHMIFLQHVTDAKINAAIGRHDGAVQMSVQGYLP